MDIEDKTNTKKTSTHTIIVRIIGFGENNVGIINKRDVDVAQQENRAAKTKAINQNNLLFMSLDINS